MAKGDDIVRRKKNKANRKKQNRQKDSSAVSARVASMIAAKKRRKAGTRRMCQGMCFSLPTPDDPFNDFHGKNNVKRSEIKKSMPSKVNQKVLMKEKNAFLKKGSVPGGNMKVDSLEKMISEKVVNSNEDHEKLIASIHNVGQTGHAKSQISEIQPDRKVGTQSHEEQTFESSYCPSKYLMMCLKEIENALCHDGTYNSGEDKPLFITTWGVEFWKCYSAGMDVLEASGSSSDVEQIAWIASTAADAIARREKEGLLFTSPFLLFLAPSKEKAVKVRSICKPLKGLGIHTVSLHHGASLDRQINGLKSCEPEFLISTPERLLELLSLKAIDISGVSLLVIDGIESLLASGYLDAIKSIRQGISGKPHTVVFNDCFKYATIPAVRNLLIGSVYRLSLNDSIASQSACIIQSIDVCASKEEKTVKGISALNNVYSNQPLPQPLKVLYVVQKDSNIQELVVALKLNGYSVSSSSCFGVAEVKDSLDSKSNMGPSVSLLDSEQINTAELGEYGVVMIPDFVLSIDNYVHILTRMARNTVDGILHCFLTKDDAPYARPLVEILEQCGQEVPEALRNLCLA
ncbi:hypothetical protein SLEP1_g42650 [Rubroshorea leprosula]|uniref:DEAD/DEAH-box helicase domain-containing protein n=1 Tax=Rubroshorea leprosula TaxID=152421 RepID=A0AAV5LAM3_9ROSI|nr:hypothetical protein SLEP1_g42650 [Rubroshorea leprosula]